MSSLPRWLKRRVGEVVSDRRKGNETMDQVRQLLQCPMDPGRLNALILNVGKRQHDCGIAYRGWRSSTFVAKTIFEGSERSSSGDGSARIIVPLAVIKNARTSLSKTREFETPICLLAGPA